MGYFFNKRSQEFKPSALPEMPKQKPVIKDKAEKKEEKVNITIEKKEEKGTMTNEEKVKAIENIVADEKPFKKIKKEKGLIERTESSKIILTEDNKQLLMD